MSTVDEFARDIVRAVAELDDDTFEEIMWNNEGTDLFYRALDRMWPIHIGAMAERLFSPGRIADAVDSLADDEDGLRDLQAFSAGLAKLTAKLTAATKKKRKRNP